MKFESPDSLGVNRPLLDAVATGQRKGGATESPITIVFFPCNAIAHWLRFCSDFERQDTGGIFCTFSEFFSLGRRGGDWEGKPLETASSVGLGAITPFGGIIEPCR